MVFNKINICFTLLNKLGNVAIFCPFIQRLEGLKSLGVSFSSRAKQFWQMCGSFKGASSLFIGLMRVVVLKGGDR
jgi:hypothetical protein